MNNLKLNLRVFKFLHSLSPAFFPLMIIRQVLSNIPFFFNLWISAEIVNELTSADDEQKIRRSGLRMACVYGRRATYKNVLA